MLSEGNKRIHWRFITLYTESYIYRNDGSRKVIHNNGRQTKCKPNHSSHKQTMWEMVKSDINNTPARFLDFILD